MSKLSIYEVYIMDVHLLNTWFKVIITLKIEAESLQVNSSPPDIVN